MAASLVTLPFSLATLSGARTKQHSLPNVVPPQAPRCRILTAPRQPLASLVAAAAGASQTASPPSLTSVPLAATFGPNDDINMVMKFGGSSVASAERMVEVAQIALSFPGTLPVIVLSAMGKTTNLLLQAGDEALKTPPGSIPSLAPLRAIKELHRETADKLGVDAATREEVCRNKKLSIDGLLCQKCVLE